MASQNATVTLQEVTKKNLDKILNLKVTPEQEKFVADNAVSIAQAYFYPEIAWFRAIYADETPVGFVMLESDRVNSSYSLWRLTIDARFQRQGFGRRAIELILEYVKILPEAKVLWTSCVPGNGSPKKFYEKMGFTDTGNLDEDGEIIMEYRF